MKLLVLGGTRFLGRHLVDAALAAGHETVLFNRGRTDANLYPELETVIGDRDGGVSVLAGRTFDGVIDTSGYVPRIVRQSASLLSDSCDFYAFISTISVYADGVSPGFDESAPTQKLKDAKSENVAEDYGALKAACEAVVQTEFPDRSLQVRAGLIVGPHDPTGRFTYWVERMAGGSEVLAPAPPDAPVQVIDARDLAEWTVRMVADQKAGVFNVTGPARRLSMGELLDECARTTGNTAEVTWVDPAFLVDRAVVPWSELPLWLPGEKEAGLMQGDIGKALEAGLRLRPLAETVRDIHAWVRDLPGPAPGEAGMAPERERALLREWRARMTHLAAVITVSDGASQGSREDESGERVAELLSSHGFEVTERVVVPDDRDRIAAVLKDSAQRVSLVVTTGGTGLGPRDVTPEATQSIIDREVPGLAELMRYEGLQKTPMAALSRAIVGTRSRTLIVNLPGSVRAVSEGLDALFPVLGHALDVLAGHTAHS